jgi:hypothetical protein
VRSPPGDHANLCAAPHCHALRDTHYFRQIRACHDSAGLCCASRVADWHHRRSASRPWRQGGRCGGCCGAGLLAGSGGGRLGWLSARVARWVADRCRRALFCVAGRCSELAFALVRPHSRWSGSAFGLHGMQEVSGSSPLSSTRNCRSGHDLRPVRVPSKIVRPSSDRRSGHLQLALSRTD